MTHQAKHIGISIDATPDQVYGFASNPENLPKWAAGVSSAVEKVGDDWMTESPAGTVKIEFAPKNAFGVLDHVVTLPSGDTVHVPMRVFANGDGSEVVITLYRQSEMSDEAFERDAGLMTKDLQTLKDQFAS